MDSQRRKELKRQYAEMRPEMGVLSFRCKATGERFLKASRNIATDITSITFKLNADFYPNRRLLALWREYGEDGFETEVVETLEYRDGVDDYQEELEALRDLCIEQDESAQLLWRT